MPEHADQSEAFPERETEQIHCLQLFSWNYISGPQYFIIKISPQGKSPSPKKPDST